MVRHLLERNSIALFVLDHLSMFFETASCVLTDINVHLVTVAIASRLLVLDGNRLTGREDSRTWLSEALLGHLFIAEATSYSQPNGYKGQAYNQIQPLVPLTLPFPCCPLRTSQLRRYKRCLPYCGGYSRAACSRLRLHTRTNITKWDEISCAVLMARPIASAQILLRW
jgi:hypothetical protein